MKKGGGRFLLILGAGLAIMAFAVVYILTSKGVSNNGGGEAQPVATAIPMITIAVAKTDIPAYSTLDANNVATMDVAASTVPSGTAMSPTELFGKTTLVSLSTQQPVMTAQVATTGFSNVIEKGKRGYTLAVPERGTFAGAITENDYVDVLWSRKIAISTIVPGPNNTQEEKNNDAYTTKTLLQNIQVLRVVSLKTATTQQSGQAQNNSTQSEPDNATKQPAATSADYATDSPPQAVLILGVTDQQAEVLKFAAENGTLDLTLRSSAPVKGPDGNVVKGPDGKDVIGDHDLEKTTGITDQILAEQYGLVLPELLIK